ncbi:hypothetical protein EX30DRAFT_372412 [Ascodesmis nigricans]|uniref:CBM-cenC domain-containing protein n=1 Tax=Ascodesmis nigricans TaxID=341454 RepID=A0A4V3SII1_9PEZI|nr:hypothetical protein EX30DRAFT_372412 [Ascodesmis nigricans]
MPGPPWTPWDNFGETRNTDEEAYSGTRSFKNTSPWTNGLFTIFHDNIPLQPLSAYDLSFWVSHKATTSLPIRWYVYQLPAGTRMTSSTQAIAQGVMEQTAEWRKYGATVSASDGGSWRFYIRFETPGSTRDVKDVWYLDDMELITYDGCTTEA